MTAPVHWLAGAPAVRARLERWIAEGQPGTPTATLRDNPRRRVVRVEDAGDPPLLVKRFRSGSGRHAQRERWKARLGRSPADREWRHLVRLHALRLPVAEPLALGVLPDGDRLLVLRFVEGRPLLEALAAPQAERRTRMAELGRAVRRLHEAGCIHGDLHPENVLVTPDGLLLLDLQHARWSRSPAARRRDLAALDYSLWWRVGVADRVRVRAAALGLERPFDAAARGQLRRIGEAADATAHAHAAGRTRRALRSGRRFARVRLRGGRGLRMRELEPEALAEALDAHEQRQADATAAVLKRGERSRVTAVEGGGRALIVKQVATRTAGRALADLFRGSAARRAWRGGHGLQARCVGAATPLAYLEQRRWGVPRASFVVLEDLRPGAPADVLRPDREDPREVLETLARLATTLHRRGVDHGDLKASHVYLRRHGAHLEARLIDLEGVRFGRRLREGRRIRALCQLNASLPDAFPAAERRRAFRRYAAALPFASGSRAALARVVEGSLARRHRWTGADCNLGRDGSGAEPGP